MLSERELSAAIGATAYGPDGDRIGTVEHFFTDDRTGAPTWVAVSTGLFGTRHSVVPATDAVLDGGGLRLPVTKEAVRTAPHVPDEHLDPEAETVLRRHYGLEPAGAETTGGGWTPTGTGMAPAGAGDDVPDRTAAAAGAPAGGVPPTVPAPVPGAAVAAAGPTAAAAGTGPRATDGATTPTSAVTTPTGGAATPTDGAMTRSEERLDVHTERVADRRVRLVKYVVTEEVHLTVPVRREEIRLEEVSDDSPDPGPGETLVPAGTEARGGAGARAGGGAGADLPGEIVLHAEKPVVTVEVVPVERVRLRTEVVRGQEQVTDQVVREQVVVDEDRRPGS
ncbi:PRC and DUF2382 domain-containing protein [Geodermatophilus marinus]|uniref:PRC and DUF2382 domain-containing protein n=1 Tax=Geodermatophilus sp. LHW52908 TaxID=2303986 RepID=UPI000E3C2A73|nr:PRC and DUF2382 domain-containing protein [Geodermatophilus sp. LHW52908]RFU21070.1 DUF2382 domain-containing protein [Geodermatophilus sp. LHW52908]